MGDVKMVPGRIRRWAYAGDSMVERGRWDNTDIGTHITEFTGENVEFKNMGRGSNTTRGMLGRQKIKGKSIDTVGKIIAGNYDGAIIGIGVNDIAGGGGGPEKRWKKTLAGLRKNLMEIYLRLWAKGATKTEKEGALNRIDERLAELKTEKMEAQKRLDRTGGKRRKMEQKAIGMIKEEAKMLQELKGLLNKTEPARGKRMERVVFVEGAPWKKGTRNWTKKKGERTRQYNEMLKEAGYLLNEVLETGPEFEVAEIYKTMASEKDNMKMKERYKGTKANGKDDYLHPGNEGRKAMARAISEQVFPDLLKDKKQDKKPGVLVAAR
ncbi:hypothetical protein GF415_01010 [Candidatus Micrarchaeota archaeon]|nr:hypothetical protein [Candidatus Micrarchaeota archaeon]